MAEEATPDEQEESTDVPSTAGGADGSVAPDSKLTRGVLEKVAPQDPPGEGTQFHPVPEFDFLCDNTFGSGPQAASVLSPDAAAPSFEWRFTHNTDLLDPFDPVDGSECILYASADEPEWNWHTTVSFSALPDTHELTCPFIREDLGGYCESWDDEGTVIMALPDESTGIGELRQLLDSARP